MSDRPPVPAFHPSRLVLVLTRRPDRRGLLLECPHLPAWSVTARGPAQLAHRIDEAWRELRVRAYAEQRQEEYDLAPLAEQVSRPVPAGDPWAWTEVRSGPHAGKWRSPAGRHYRPDAAVVGKVLAARQRQGAQAG